MAHSDLDEAVDQLYAVPLEAFVAERKRLAKELRSGGDRPAAAELAKLPKPSAPAWALNHVAREQPDAVGDWLGAAEALRDASTHAADVGGDAIRRAMADHRTATARLTAVVRESAQPSGRPLSEPMLDRVRALLQAATADARVADRLRAGQIMEEAATDEAAADEGGFDAAAWVTAAPDEAGSDAGTQTTAAPDEAGSDGGAPETAAPDDVESEDAYAAPETAAADDVEAEDAVAEPAETEPPARPRRDRGAELRAKRRAELERRVRETSDEHDRLLERAAEREEAAESAEERVEEARRALHRSESEAAAARAAADEAEDAAAATERDLQQLRARLRRAGD